jgi:hypothetical protein
MKSLLLSALVLMSSIQALAIVAGPKIFTAPVSAQANSLFGDIASGDIQINLSDRELSLSITNAVNCAAHTRICLSARPRVTQIDLPVVSLKKGVCGDVIYTAFSDAMPVDGLRETIVVTDHTGPTCLRLIAPLAPTEIVYTRESMSRRTGTLSKETTALTAGSLIQIKY